MSYKIATTGEYELPVITNYQSSNRSAANAEAVYTDLLPIKKLRCNKRRNLYYIAVFGTATLIAGLLVVVIICTLNFKIKPARVSKENIDQILAAIKEQGHTALGVSKENIDQILAAIKEQEGHTTLGLFEVKLTTDGRKPLDVERQHYLSDYNAFPSDDCKIRFYAQGSAGVRLTLESTIKPRKSDIFYYIRIGNANNTQSYIQHVTKTLISDLDQLKAIHYGSQICNLGFSPFWVSWCGRNIQAGRGLFFKNIFLSYENPCPFKVVDIGVTSGQYMHWTFSLRNQSRIVTSKKRDQSAGRFTYQTKCPWFEPLRSFIAQGFQDCSTSCNIDKECEAFIFNRNTHMCHLKLGTIVQEDRTTTVYRKLP